MLLPVTATALLVATLPLAAGCRGSDSPEAASATTATSRAAQHVAVKARDTELLVKGAGSLHAGFVRLEVRNEGRGQHGIELVQLKRPLTTMQLLDAFAAEKRAWFDALGGIQQVVPGRPWEMTERLGPGSYALLDFAQNESRPNYARGLYKRFEVAPSQSRDVPPVTVGGIEMRDFRFDLRLRNGFSGRGVVKIANRGKTSHEISLVRIEPGHSQGEVLRLILAGARKPPEWASIVELLSALDPAKTAYVRLDLIPGRYVALCLMNEPGSQTLHAQLGMIGTFDVTRAAPPMPGRRFRSPSNSR
jgi:hypothetical protein